MHMALRIPLAMTPPEVLVRRISWYIISFIYSNIYTHILIFTEHPSCARALFISVFSLAFYIWPCEGSSPSTDAISPASRSLLTLLVSPRSLFSTLLPVSFQLSFWTLEKHHQLWKVLFRTTELVFGMEKRDGVQANKRHWSPSFPPSQGPRVSSRPSSLLCP